MPQKPIRFYTAIVLLAVVVVMLFLSHREQNNHYAKTEKGLCFHLDIQNPDM